MNREEYAQHLQTLTREQLVSECKQLRHKLMTSWKAGYQAAEADHLAGNGFNPRRNPHHVKGTS